MTSVRAVRYGTVVGRRSGFFLNWQVYGEPDADLPMDYFFWVLTDDAGRVTVLDCGFDPTVGARRGRRLLVDPVEALAHLGIDAARVERLIVSHAHYDHIGNLHRFPTAEVVLSRREFEFWTGPFASRPQFAHSVERGELDALSRADAEGRVTTFDGELTLGDLHLVEVGGHTPGQLVVVAPVPGGEAVLAADALHFHEEMQRDRPFFVVADLAAMYAGYDTLADLAAGRVLVSGHDPLEMDRLPGRLEGSGIDDLVIEVASPREY